MEILSLVYSVYIGVCQEFMQAAKGVYIFAIVPVEKQR